MSYEITLKGAKDVYTVSDEQGEKLKNVLRTGAKDGFIEFGAIMIPLWEVKMIKQVLDIDKLRTLDDPRYQTVKRTSEGFKSLRELIYKHTKNLKTKGVLPKDYIFPTEKELEEQI